jgi:hypothetical protein
MICRWTKCAQSSWLSLNHNVIVSDINYKRLCYWHCHRIGSAWYAQFFHSLVRRHGGRPVTDSGSPPAARRHGQWQAQPRLADWGRWPPVTGDQSVVTGLPTGSLRQCQGPGGTESESLQCIDSAPQFTPYHSTYVFSCIYTYMYVYVGICKYMHVSARISMALAENTLSTKCMYMYVLVRTCTYCVSICMYMLVYVYIRHSSAVNVTRMK